MRNPNFFIVGAPRSGTTSLYHCVRAHPEIFMPELKEPHFFGTDLRFRIPRITFSEYQALFADDSGARRSGEASTWYLSSRVAAQQIFEFNPESQILVMLRNPVEMAYSLHSQRLLVGAEDVADFGEALERETERAKGRLVPDGCQLVESLLYRRAASYGEQLERFFAVFGEERIHVQAFEDYREHPRSACREVFRFLGVSDEAEPTLYRKTNENRRVRSPAIRYWIQALQRSSSLRRLARSVASRGTRKRFFLALRNWNSVAVERPALPEELRDELRSWFRPDVERLSGLVNRDFVQLWAP